MVAKRKHWLFTINPRFFVRRIIPALAAVAALVWFAVFGGSSNALDVYFLNVGQGDAIYGRTPTGEDFLIDGGPNNKVLSELGKVMSFWDREIDLVIATHNHSDHIGGLDDVLEKYEVKEIWISGSIHTTQTYFKFLEAAKKEKENGAALEVVKAGDQISLGDATFRVLFPLKSQEGSQPSDQHDATLVTKLSYGDIDYLLTGDINEGHEQEILNSSFDILNSEILKVPHHGSATGLRDQFLDAVNPEIAVIQVGAKNRFGHPSDPILGKLEDRAITTYRTDQNGRIKISSDGKNIFVKTKK